MTTKRQQLKEGKITEDEYFIEYGKVVERLRILDALTETNKEIFHKDDIRQLIKDINDTHPEQDFGKPEGKES